MAYTNTITDIPQVSRDANPESHPGSSLPGRGPSESGEGQCTLTISNHRTTNNRDTNPKHKLKNQGLNMNIATWNVRTLLDSQRKESITIPRKTAVVAREMKRLGVDIAGLQASEDLKKRKLGIPTSGQVQKNRVAEMITA